MDDRSAPAAHRPPAATPSAAVPNASASSVATETPRDELIARAAGGTTRPGDDGEIDRLLAAASDTAVDGVDDIDHDLVRAADPLGLDDRLSRLPHVNRMRHVPTLTRWLVDAVSSRFDESRREHAIAAMRDIGMLLSSLRRHGAQPAACVDGVSDRLQRWGEIAGMVPRDTVVHYSLWNPVGARERRFTLEYAQESALIDSVRRSCRLLPIAAAGLADASRLGLRGPAAMTALADADQAITAFGAAFTGVHHHVSPVYFAQELRPYFDPYEVDGQAWIGPAAAFTPLFLVTGRLYAPDEPERQLETDAKIYGRPLWRRSALAAAVAPPLVAVMTAPSIDTCAPDHEAVHMVDDIMRALLRFQGQHLTMARRSYAEQITTYRRGSGGFPVDALKTITDDTREIAHTVAADRR